MKKINMTPFEWQVLKATMTIPLGQTRSYQWVAKTIGRPRAVRAVGQALKKNPFPLIVPCHRVVKSSGDFGNYSCGGRKVKQSLIVLEKEISRYLKGPKRKQ